MDRRGVDTREMGRGRGQECLSTEKRGSANRGRREEETREHDDEDGKKGK
jgi:hypothetical protein